jgi:hypothetical protein
MWQSSMSRPTLRPYASSEPPMKVQPEEEMCEACVRKGCEACVRKGCEACMSEHQPNSCAGAMHLEQEGYASQAPTKSWSTLRSISDFRTCTRQPDNI